jgi:hypothetical protein
MKKNTGINETGHNDNITRRRFIQRTATASAMTVFGGAGVSRALADFIVSATDPYKILVSETLTLPPFLVGKTLQLDANGRPVIPAEWRNPDGTTRSIEYTSQKTYAGPKENYDAVSPADITAGGTINPGNPPTFTVTAATVTIIYAKPKAP